MDIIHWEQAYQDFQHNKKEDLEEVKRLLKEIETSNFEILDANDVQYYAGQLNYYSNRKYTEGKNKGKPNPYTANEVRRINMNATGNNGYNYLQTFVGDSTDDVIDFF